MSDRLDDSQTDDGRWLGDQESNLDSQIQNLMSYQLDDPQKERAPEDQCLLGFLSRRQTTACLQLCEGGLHGLLLDDAHQTENNQLS